MKDRSKRDLASRIIALGMALASIVGAADGKAPVRDLTEATLEDLMNLEVSTVSRKYQKLAQAPAAVYVITQENIRRSGMTSLPELLRTVPGLQVDQAQGGQWAIGARGFNDSYSNKLLVLVDGRTVYSPVDSGVFWDEQDMLLENIERIEVIRGPGATLWGANAVSGVINIITKTSGDTQGTLVTTGVGSEGQSLAGVRFGGQMGGTGHYRISTKYLHGPSLLNPAGSLSGQSSLTAGLRADWTSSLRDTFTVQADAFRSKAESGIDRSLVSFAAADNEAVRTSGGSLMATWIRTQSETSKSTLQVYFSHPERSETIYSSSYSTIDVDFHHELALSEANSLVWGLGFRDSELDTSGSDYITFSPSSRNLALFSAFVQDQWSIVPDRVSLILGSKFEHNDFTGYDIQPGARILWTPDSRHTLWAAVSRAVRAPSMLESGLEAHPGVLLGPDGIPILLSTVGSPEFRSENVLAYELGYRLQAKRRFSVDVAAYRNAYSHLKSYEPGEPVFVPAPQPHLTVETRFGNLTHGETHGFEIAPNVRITDRWRLTPSYSWLRINMHLDAGSRDTVSRAYIEGQSPRHQFQFRSNFDITRKLQFDAAAYYTGARPNLSVLAYTRLDAHLSYRPRPDLEISLAGQNLQGGRHAEFVSAGPYTRATVGRRIMVMLTWGL